MYFRICCFIITVFFANTTSVFSQNKSNDKINAYFKRLGIQVIKPADHLERSKNPLQNLFEMQVSLEKQQNQHLLDAPLLKNETVRPAVNKFSILEDNFENAFPENNWQVLHTSKGGAWGKNGSSAISGSFCVWCGTNPFYGATNASIKYPESTLTWLVSGPYDLTQVEDVKLNFYSSVKTQVDTDIFFWGASVNAKDFYGIGASGDSQGWQFVNFILNEIPVLGNLNGFPQVWIAFMFASNGSVSDEGVFIDKVNLSHGPGWLQEFSGELNGKFTPNIYSGGIGLSRPAFVDIDNDADFDLFVGEYDGNISFYRNDGDKSQPQWIFVDSYYAAIDVGDNSAPAFADLDKDGDQDLFVGNSKGTIHFFRNDGTVLSPVWVFIGELIDTSLKIIDVGSISTPTFFDIDQDGDFDLFIGQGDGRIAFYRNNSTFSEMVWTLISTSFQGIGTGPLSTPTFADIDGDGLHDIFAGYREKEIYFFKNTGTLSQPAFELMSKTFADITVGHMTSPAFADIDGDSDLDLLIGEAEGKLSLFTNKGSKSKWIFDPLPQDFDLQTIDVGFQSSPELVDLDADGDLDLVLGSSDQKFHFYRNDGSKTHPKWNFVADYFGDIVVNNWSTPAFVDIDNDGDLDLFSGTKLSRLAFIRNDGTNTNPAWKFVTDFYDFLSFDSQTLSPVFADIDSDGDFDLFVGKNLKGVSFFENIGTAEKAEWKLIQSDFLNSQAPRRVTPVFADIDKDGDLDLFSGSQQGTIQFYENTGDRTNPKFSLLDIDYLNSSVRLFSTPAFGDIDHDGDLDLFVGNNSGGLNFWRNMSAEPTFLEKSPDLAHKTPAASVALKNLPMPFNPGSSIQYKVLKDSEISVNIYNLLGKPIVKLLQKHHSKGIFTTTWDGRDNYGKEVTNGFYLIRFDAGIRAVSHKIMLLRQ